MLLYNNYAYGSWWGYSSKLVNGFYYYYYGVRIFIPSYRIRLSRCLAVCLDAMTKNILDRACLHAVGLS